MTQYLYLPLLLYHSAQWRSLVVCRALCHCDRDIVLLDGPTDALSESRESAFFRALRADLRRDQVAVVACNRFASAVNADHVIVMSQGRIVQQGTYAQLISQPGPFRDELMPTPKPYSSALSTVGSSSSSTTSSSSYYSSSPSSYSQSSTASASKRIY